MYGNYVQNPRWYAWTENRVFVWFGTERIYMHKSLLPKYFAPGTKGSGKFEQSIVNFNRYLTTAHFRPLNEQPNARFKFKTRDDFFFLKNHTAIINFRDDMYKPMARILLL